MRLERLRRVEVADERGDGRRLLLGGPLAAEAAEEARDAAAVAWRRDDGEDLAGDAVAQVGIEAQRVDVGIDAAEPHQRVAHRVQDERVDADLDPATGSETIQK